MYPSINKQKAYDLDGIYSISEMVGEKGLWLLYASQLTNKQINYISQQVINFHTL